MSADHDLFCTKCRSRVWLLKNGNLLWGEEEVCEFFRKHMYDCDGHFVLINEDHEGEMYDITCHQDHSVYIKNCIEKDLHQFKECLKKEFDLNISELKDCITKNQVGITNVYNEIMKKL